MHQIEEALARVDEKSTSHPVTDSQGYIVHAFTLVTYYEHTGEPTILGLIIAS
jgi:hypothetical protein